MAIAFVQGNVEEAAWLFGGSTATSLTGVAAGNCLVGAAAVYDNVTVGSLTLSDNQGNSWNSLTQQSFAAGQGAIQLFYALNVAAGTTNVSIATGADSDNQVTLAVAEFSGVATASAVDIAVAGETGTSSTPTGDATGTLSDAGNVVLAACSHFNGNISITPGASFLTAGEFEDGTAGMPLSLAYLLPGSTSTVTPSWTLASSQDWAVSRVVLKVAATATKAPPLKRRQPALTYR